MEIERKYITYFYIMDTMLPNKNSLVKERFPLSHSFFRNFSPSLKGRHGEAGQPREA